MANSSAHPVRAGFEQAGAYFMALQDLAPLTGTIHTYTITTAATSSGGATTEPVFTTRSMEAILEAAGSYTGLDATEAAAFVSANKLIRDMGKTVVSAGRTFRKFQVVATGIASGVVGSTAASPSLGNAGYGSFYLDVTRNGAEGAVPAPILRYF